MCISIIWILIVLYVQRYDQLRVHFIKIIYSSLMHCVSLLIARFSQELDIKGFSNQTISKINWLIN